MNTLRQSIVNQWHPDDAIMQKRTYRDLIIQVKCNVKGRTYQDFFKELMSMIRNNMEETLESFGLHFEDIQHALEKEEATLGGTRETKSKV